MGITSHENCAPGITAYEQKQEERATKAAVGAIDDAKCQSYGLQPGSPPMDDRRLAAVECGALHQPCLPTKCEAGGPQGRYRDHRVTQYRAGGGNHLRLRTGIRGPLPRERKPLRSMPRKGHPSPSKSAAAPRRDQMSLADVGCGQVETVRSERLYNANTVRSGYSRCFVGIHRSRHVLQGSWESANSHTSSEFRSHPRNPG